MHDGDRHETLRQRMVEQLILYGVRDEAVLEAMARVPRHRFVPPARASSAYADAPLPIGGGQTISQPFMVARMTELAQPGPHHQAVDVGCGSGYQAAVLAELVDRVYAVELDPTLADAARERLAGLGYRNVEVRCADGSKGWPEHAPFDCIIVAAAPERIPPALVEQLAPGGVMVIPVGPDYGVQTLTVVTKDRDGRVSERPDDLVRFVPLRSAD
ncbi:MAG: protein-L-isoaspartate(D-aspartate) O-methyltransferase [Myxococcota bacterium]